MSTALAFTLLVCRKSRAWLHSCKPDHFECLILKVIYFLSLCTRLVGSELDDYPQTTHRRRRFNRPWLSSCWVSTVHMEMSETQAKTVKSARRNNLQSNRLLGIHPLYGLILLPYWSSFLCCGESAPLKVERSYHALALSNPALSGAEIDLHTHVRHCDVSLSWFVDQGKMFLQVKTSRWNHGIQSLQQGS